MTGPRLPTSPVCPTMPFGVRCKVGGSLVHALVSELGWYMKRIACLLPGCSCDVCAFLIHCTRPYSVSPLHCSA